ncbi:MAG: hypothetical protein DRJ61_13905 [Acidobacteria bacterium]|nr:MAG: hypothetical protein DRJ61_13905 [Acidobacteriota bacterium]
MNETRRNNCARVESLVGPWAREHHWPQETALTYLRDILDYEIGPQQLAAIRLFWNECADLGLIDEFKKVKILEI